MSFWHADNYHLQSTAHHQWGTARKAVTPEPCAVCGKSETVGHHEDYAKPFDVIWLCLSHHRRIHNSERRATIIEGLEPISYAFAPWLRFEDYVDQDWQFEDAA